MVVYELDIYSVLDLCIILVHNNYYRYCERKTLYLNVYSIRSPLAEEEDLLFKMQGSVCSHSLHI